MLIFQIHDKSEMDLILSKTMSKINSHSDKTEPIWFYYHCFALRNPQVLNYLVIVIQTRSLDPSIEI